MDQIISVALVKRVFLSYCRVLNIPSSRAEVHWDIFFLHLKSELASLAVDNHAAKVKKKDAQVGDAQRREEDRLAQET